MQEQYIQPVLGALTVLLLAGAFAALLHAGDKENMNLIVGAIIGQFVAVMQFYFGSSSSSRKKDETIASQGAALAISAPVNPPPPA